MKSYYLDFPGTTYSDLHGSLLSDERETCAAVLGNVVSDGARARVLVTDVILPSDADYSVRTKIATTLNPVFVSIIARRAASEKKAVVFVHTHPFGNGLARFSPVDDEGETHLAEYLARQKHEGPNIALVLSPGGAAARLLGSKTPVAVREISQQVWILSEQPTSTAHSKFDRQVRLVGESGQYSLQAARIGIVGVGGTGSVVAQELAYLGVRSLLLVDPDVIEETNINRVVGATPNSVGASKVDVARKMVMSIAPSAAVDAIAGDIRFSDVVGHLLSCDLLFCCTDSHGSRAILNQIAYQYLIPCIDLGVAIVSDGKQITHIAGRVQLLAPNQACLICTNNINTDQVRYDLMTEEQKKSDPYFLGQGEPAPAIVSVNSTVSSLATTMFLGVIAGLQTKARYLHYNGLQGAVRPVAAPADPNCIICSRFGALARGDSWPLPTLKSR